ncbi:MAG TPA: UDP-N-acetylmuramoyl-L-alanyl-D-glutamate--2,6-diaminopimelate ligase [Chitinophagales bacterium]|nr:UDP-N-acetylmuramoyl-L-alanyl-D-glutamate--2,6-diaminopimelate ligase [Chitinophagales bacterium]
MKKLSDILYKVSLIGISGSTDVEVSDVCFDSRKAQPHSLFVATRGTVTDGHAFISAVEEKGVAAIICENFPEKKKKGITYIRVADSSVALAIAAENFFDNPSSKLKVIAVTGTNGKTTVATLLCNLFSGLNYKCGLISTVENRINGKTIPAIHTTPDAVQLSSLMNDMVKAGCAYCFMEASSHAIHQNRVAGVKFTGAVFTNISHDHLDYHKTFQDYIEAKKKLFDLLPADAFALVNVDDKRGMVMLQNTRAHTYTYALQSIADFRARILEITFNGMVLQIDGEEVYTPLVGSFNAYNLLAIYGTALILGEQKIPVLTVLSKLKPAEGRFDYVLSEKNKIMGIVDYAHTPDALEKMLTTIKEIRTGNEKLITVVGCGGDRDAAKRPVMAKVASELSDQIILTSDNPRSEEPLSILEQMHKGIVPVKLSRTLTIADRREAIRTAVAMSAKGDIILLAGKGHEKYQEIKGVKHPFDDKIELNEAFRTMEK